MRNIRLSVLLPLLVCVLCARAAAEEPLFPVVSGWTMAVESRVYDPNDLWDIIDGAADLYLEYAFVDLHIARYTTATNRQVKAELYRHRDAENAFGIYAAERSPEYHFVPIGVQGYQSTSILNFVAGEYYLRLSSYQADPQSVKDLEAVARAIEQHLKRDGSFPKNVGLFPVMGKQKNSEQFVAQNFLGYSFLGSVYTALYGTDHSVKAFIIEKRSRHAADSTLNAYRSKLEGEQFTQPEPDHYEIRDKNNGPVTLALKGRYLFGVLNCTDDRVKNEILNELKRTLSAD